MCSIAAIAEFEPLVCNLFLDKWSKDEGDTKLPPCDKHGLYAAKRLRTYARINKEWWTHTRMHPDNLIAPPRFTMAPWLYHLLHE